MHARVGGVILVAMMAVSASAYEYLFEDFDGAPNGSVSAVAGWEASPSTIPIIGAAMIEDNPVAPGDRFLSLGGPGTLSLGVRALYTNFHAAYDPSSEQSRILVSAWVRTDRTDIPWKVGLRHSSDNLGIHVGCRETDGQLFVTNDLSGAVNFTGRFVSTGVLALVELYYDRGDAGIICRYNGTNLITSWNSGAPVRQTFNQFRLYRPNAGSTAGNVRFQDVSVETFRNETLGWWRFHPPSGAPDDPACRWIIPEVTARVGIYAFPPPLTNAIDYGVSDPLYDGHATLRNPRIPDNGYAGVLALTEATGIFSNWTLESFVRQVDTNSNWSLADWGTAPSHESNSYISVSVGNGRVRASMRDRFVLNSGSDFYSDLGAFPADGAWHHLALVKTGTNLVTYVDYRAVASTVLGFRSAYEYSFHTFQGASVGISMNNAGLIRQGDGLDEVRFSSEALPTSSMLQFGRPEMLSEPVDVSPVWRFNVRTIPLFPYEVYGSTTLTSGWTLIGARTATGHITTISTSMTNAPWAFYRAARDFTPP